MKLILRSTRHPSQLWLLFAGTFASSMGQSLVWPFLTITMRERLDVPLTTITSLFTLQAIAGFAATAALGPLMDRAGRKWPMFGGLVASGAVLVAMSQAETLTLWIILFPLYGMVNSVFRIGSYAMVADLVEPERRAGMYSLLRMSDNLGIVIGPAFGGLLIRVAWALSYLAAAGIQFALAVFVALILRETLVRRRDTALILPNPNSGYGPLLRDTAFLRVWGLYILNNIASSMVFVLLGLYVKENFAITEDRFGQIIAVNAAMVVLFQYHVTRLTSRRAPLPIIAVGALFYAGGMALYALSRGYVGFLLGMIVMTVGELLLVPTTTTLVANLAPPDMRARYMGVFSLSFRVGAGIGPVVGGLLSDHIAPVATWYGGMLFCLTSAAGFWWLARSETARLTALQPTEGREPAA